MKSYKLTRFYQLFYLYNCSLYVYEKNLILATDSVFLKIKLPSAIIFLSKFFYYKKKNILYVDYKNIELMFKNNILIETQLQMMYIEFFTFLSNILYDLIIKYKEAINLKGLGYRILYNPTKHVFKLFVGHSIPLYFKSSNLIQINIKNNKMFYLISEDKSFLRTFLINLQKLRYPSAYKEQGIYIEGKKYKLKVIVKS